MGPTVSILLDKVIDKEVIAKIDVALKEISKGEVACEGYTRDLYVDSSKLLKNTSLVSESMIYLSFDNELKEFEPGEVDQIKEKAGVDVMSQVIVYAGGKTQETHTILGELSLIIARLLGGIIDYGGVLEISEGEISKIDGGLLNIKDPDGDIEGHISDVLFLENWIKHPQFRLIK